MLILAERLALLRGERDMTQKEVGQELGISLNSYQRYETNERGADRPPSWFRWQNFTMSHWTIWWA